jgi:predicted nucleotidyltransferase
MDLKELDSFKMSDAITFHDKLNPKLFRGTHLQSDVSDQLKVIAQDFLEELGIKGLDVKDITISGSNAAYSYTPNSDLDLHILVDLSQYPDDEIYQELFHAKKTIYNDSHNIKVHGIPVELYVQDSNEPVISLGEYSILKDKWLRIPTKRRSNLDQTATKQKYEKLLKLAEYALKSKKLSKVKQILQTIKRYRQAGLDKGGEFGPENLAFKALRSQGIITKLYDLRDKLHSQHLSIESMYSNDVDEDYHPNGKPPGPEFKPTMPAGTVRVDVSDVYDWYKLGQNISDLGRADPNMFGKGPPSTIMSFGDEDTEHKYINDLEKTGLTTTDIDPVDPKQPKGMKRQKTDPTYNVSEQETMQYAAEKIPATNPYGGLKDRQYRGSISEIRKNPEQNLKSESGMKELASIAKTISDPENWAISMTSEPKLGINPQVGISEDTPKGIYFYPLNYALGKTRYGKLPWGNDYPYIQLFQYDRSREMTKQTKVDPAKLKQALLQYCPEEVIQQAIDDPEYDGTPYWFIYDCLSRLGQNDETNIVRWNKILRDLGFTSVYDDGDGWIAYNEPTQGVVLDPRVIKQHKTIVNKKQSGVVTPAAIEQAIFDTLDIELAANRAWQAYDPDGSKLRSAAKEYAKDPKFKPYYGKPGTEEIFNKAEGWGRYGARQLSDIAYEWYKQQQSQSKVNEASGYIPSNAQKNDPRFKTALTVDVKPDSIKKNAKAFAWLTDRAGIPPAAKANGKIS